MLAPSEKRVLETEAIQQVIKLINTKILFEKEWQYKFQGIIKERSNYRIEVYLRIIHELQKRDVINNSVWLQLKDVTREVEK